MTDINGYSLLGEFTTNNAGFCRWAYCEKGGHKFFIKEFLDPIYPIGKTELSQKTIARKQKICEEFYQRKQTFYDTLSKCRTGNIAFIVDFFRSGSKYYAVSDKMEFDVYEFSDVARANQDVKETLMRSILYSFAQMHKAGIVHADVKPDNMLIKKTHAGYFTAKIIDFDSGFLLTDIPEEVQGDFVYLAPEAYQKMLDSEVSIDEKIDVFALGIIFHQLWTGKLPQTDNDYNYIFEAVLDDCAIRLSNAIPDVHRDLITKMLSKLPNDRPSAMEVLKSFRNSDSNVAIEEETDNDAVSNTRKKSLFSVPKDMD